MGKTLLRLSLRVKLDKIKSNFFYFCFGFLFQFLPDIAAQFTYFRDSTILASILLNFMKRVDIDIKNIAVFINDPYSFL